MKDAKKVLFNNNIRITTALIEALKTSGKYEPWASHSHEDQSMMAAASPNSFLEPTGLTGDEYAAWLLDAAQQRGIEIIFAGKERMLLADWTERFAERGITLITPASREMQELLDDKEAFLEDWDHSILPIPRWRTFRDLASFEVGRYHLEGIDPERRLCFKPAHGIYASGFRAIQDPPSLKKFLSGELYEISLASAREMFSSGELPRMLLMQMLEGGERSIDCLAWQGQLIAASVRHKESSSQFVEDRPDLIEAARRIASRYHLSGIFNFQTRDDMPGGRPHMLEINARPSGGLRYAIHAGIDYATLLMDAASGTLPPGAWVEAKPGEYTERRLVHRFGDAWSQA